jgi:hypothetical protein
VSQTSPAETKLPDTPVVTAHGTAILVAQAAASVVAQFVVWMILTALSGVPSDVVWLAVASLLISFLSIQIGLPIRLVARVHQWWIARPWIAIAGIVLGLIVVALGFVTSTRTVLSDGPPDAISMWFNYNWTLIWPGIVILVFAICHYWPRFALAPAKPIGRDGSPVDR